MARRYTYLALRIIACTFRLERVTHCSLIFTLDNSLHLCRLMGFLSRRVMIRREIDQQT